MERKPSRAISMVPDLCVQAAGMSIPLGKDDPQEDDDDEGGPSGLPQKKQFFPD